MKDLFNDDIKNRLEDSGPEELGYRPDREKLWNRIAATPPPTVRRLPFRKWITHAAAIAAGFVLAFIFLYRQPEVRETVIAKQMPPVRHNTAEATATPEAATGNRQEVAGDRQGTVPKMAHREIQKTRTTAPTQQAASLPAKQEASLPAPVSQPGLPLPEERTIAAVTQPHTPPVLHLNDLNNENATARNSVRKAPGFIDKLAVNNPGQAPEGAAIYALVGSLLQSSKN